MTYPHNRRDVPTTKDLDELTAQRQIADARYQSTMLWLSRITAFCLLATLAFLTAIAIQNYYNGKRLVDCTTTGHYCYDQATERSTVLVEELLAAIREDNDEQTKQIVKELERVIGE